MAIRVFAKKVFLGSVLTGAASLVFGVILASCAWLYIKNTIQGEVVTVPDLLGSSIEDAQARVEDLDLVFQIEDGQKVFSNVIPADRVYLQIPRPGRKIKTGRIVEVTISAGPEKKLIPKLEGETLNFSSTLLKGVGKKVDILSRAPSSLQDRGRVLAQSPKAGEDPEILRSMALLVSDGEQYPWYVMPDLNGRDYETVKAFLDRHEFRMITRYQADDPDLGPVVLRQIPQPGFAVNKSQTITLIVNKDF